MEPPEPAVNDGANDPPPLYKTYFNDPTLSDLTIKLSDRSVYVHRIVLCRGSEYFDKLLTGRFKENDSKEIELCGDDPEAMMTLLRHLYGLPYPMDPTGQHDCSLLTDALVYVATEKYQVKKLQAEASMAMKNVISDKKQEASLLVESSYLSEALCVMIAGTPTGDTDGREVLLAYCVRDMKRLSQHTSFMAVVAETPELGAELIRCQYATKPDEIPTSEVLRASTFTIPTRRGRGGSRTSGW